MPVATIYARGIKRSIQFRILMKGMGYHSFLVIRKDPQLSVLDLYEIGNWYRLFFPEGSS